MKYKYLILGAGPAGLALANSLLNRGETDFLVLEKEGEAGGLCRSTEADGSPLDTGGGHFLDVRRPGTDAFLFSFMPEEEWDVYERDSRIRLGDTLIEHPIEANIWQMDLERQVAYLKSIAQAGCNSGAPKPEQFVDWIYWKLGRKIADEYMIPYNEKMFGGELDHLGVYWLEKLPSVSFEQTLRSCLEKRAYGSQPGHARFYYPRKYGYGELWRRMAERLGDRLKLSTPVTEINFGDTSVNGMYQAGRIITTIPWTGVEKLTGMPETLLNRIQELKYASVAIQYYPDNLDTQAQWIYEPDRELDYHRILVRHNFCPGARGYWTETNVSRFKKQDGAACYINEYAYPLNTVTKPEVMEQLLAWSEGRRVTGLGRWGEWEHYNSDAVVEKAMELAERI